MFVHENTEKHFPLYTTKSPPMGRSLISMVIAAEAYANLSKPRNKKAPCRRFHRLGLASTGAYQ